MSNKRFNIYDEYNADMQFYKLPKVFFTNKLYADLSNNAKISWCIMRDRLSVSQKNNWIDEDGNIYFIYSNDKLAEILGLSIRTVTRIKQELTQVNLFESTKQGLNKPDILYLKYPIVTKKDIYKINNHETENTESGNHFLNSAEKEEQATNLVSLRHRKNESKSNKNKPKSYGQDKIGVSVEKPLNQHSYGQDKIGVSVEKPLNQHSYGQDNLARQEVPIWHTSKTNTSKNIETIETIETNKIDSELNNIAISVFIEEHLSSYVTRKHLNKILLVSGNDINKAEHFLKSFNMAKKKIEDEINYKLALNVYFEDEQVNEIIDTMLNQYIYRKRKNEIDNEGAYVYTIQKNCMLDLASLVVSNEFQNKRLNKKQYEQIIEKIYKN